MIYRTLWLDYKKYLEEEDSVENRQKVERYLINDCEDPNDDKLEVLGW